MVKFNKRDDLWVKGTTSVVPGFYQFSHDMQQPGFINDPFMLTDIAGPEQTHVLASLTEFAENGYSNDKFKLYNEELSILLVRLVLLEMNI